jgi:hypothetical protein
MAKTHDETLAESASVKCIGIAKWPPYKLTSLISPSNPTNPPPRSPTICRPPIPEQ